MNNSQVYFKVVLIIQPVTHLQLIQPQKVFTIQEPATLSKQVMPALKPTQSIYISELTSSTL